MSIFYRADGWVKNTLGQAIAGAQIFLCQQPANAPITLAGGPPSVQVLTYADSGGLTPVAQPILTDGFGHYSFYAAPGFYTLLVYYGGSLQQTYTDQLLG